MDPPPPGAHTWLEVKPAECLWLPWAPWPGCRSTEDGASGPCGGVGGGHGSQRRHLFQAQGLSPMHPPGIMAHTRVTHAPVQLASRRNPGATSHDQDVGCRRPRGPRSCNAITSAH